MPHCTEHDLGQGFRVAVATPGPEIKDWVHDPWLSMTLGKAGPTWTPNTTRETAAALRALADDLDKAWAEMPEGKE